jgi:hypothetical protein
MRFVLMHLFVATVACGGQTQWLPSPTQTPLADDSGFGGGFAATSPPDLDDAGPPVPNLSEMPGLGEAGAPAASASASSRADAMPDGEATQPSGEEPAPPFDAGPDGLCALPLAAGDLEIEELMIESVAGTGDYGQWLEVQSTRDCALDLRGIHGECPRGARVATFDVTGDVWIPARGSFVVADSVNPAINHDLPGLVVPWSVRYGDILRKKGTTVTLLLSDTIIDSITYPALPLTVGVSIAFPSDCDVALRGDWSHWQWSQSSWFPGFFGTPNAPNSDVHCGT